MAMFNWPWRHSDSPTQNPELNIKEESFELSDKKGSSLVNLISKNSIKSFIVKAVGFVSAYSQRTFIRPEYNLSEIRDASEADSYVKISLSKTSYLIYKAGWNFRSENQQAIDYLEQRFKIMSFCTGVPMDILMQGIAMH